MFEYCRDLCPCIDLCCILQSLLKTLDIEEVPVAVLLNKTDLTEAVGEEFLAGKLGVHVTRTGKVRPVLQSYCALLSS